MGNETVANSPIGTYPVAVDKDAQGSDRQAVGLDFGAVVGDVWTPSRVSATNPLPVTGTITGTTSVNVTNGSGASAVNIQDGGNSITVDGTVSITANSSVNLAQVAGTATAVNAGNASAGTPRVVLATDQAFNYSGVVGSGTIPANAVQLGGEDQFNVFQKFGVNGNGNGITTWPDFSANFRTFALETQANVNSASTGATGSVALSTSSAAVTVAAYPYVSVCLNGTHTGLSFTFEVQPVSAGNWVTCSLLNQQTRVFETGITTQSNINSVWHGYLRGVAFRINITAIASGSVVGVVYSRQFGDDPSLPAGAATEAKQTQPGVDIGDVTINNAAGASAVNIQDGGNSITVDGTVTADTELPAAVALADGQSNPTAPAVGGFGMSYNPTKANWYRNKSFNDSAPSLQTDSEVVNPLPSYTTISTNITASGQVAQLDGYEFIDFQFSGTFTSGSVVFEAATTGSSYSSKTCTYAYTDSTTTTLSGSSYTWRLRASNLQSNNFRIRCTGLTSGTITVTAKCYRFPLAVDSTRVWGTVNANINNTVGVYPVGGQKMRFEGATVDFASITGAGPGSASIIFTTTQTILHVRVKNTTDVALIYSLDGTIFEGIPPNVSEFIPLASDMGGYLDPGVDIYAAYEGTAPTKGAIYWIGSYY
jgi:hypothetical protein